MYWHMNIWACACLLACEHVCSAGTQAREHLAPCRPPSQERNDWEERFPPRHQEVSAFYIGARCWCFLVCVVPLVPAGSLPRCCLQMEKLLNEAGALEDKGKIDAALQKYQKCVLGALPHDQ